MGRAAKRFFENDELEEDSAGLRKALLRELGIDENSEKLRRKEIHLTSPQRRSIRPAKKHSNVRVNDGKDGKAGAVDPNSLREESGSAPATSSDLDPFDLPSLRRREAELEGELRGVRHVLQMLCSPDGSSPSSDVLSLKSEIMFIKDRLNEQTALLHELKRDMLGPSRRDKHARRSNRK